MERDETFSPVVVRVLSAQAELVRHLRDAEGEQRYVPMGPGTAGDLLVAVWADLGDESRVISARRPTRKERNCCES